MTAAAADAYPGGARGAALWALAPVYLLTVLLPVSVFLGPLNLSLLRILLLVVTIPLLLQLLRGRYGPVIATDWLLLGFVLWMTAALAVNNPDRVIQQAPSVGVEFLGGYVLARATIRSPDAFLRLCRLLMIAVIVLLPAALIETRTGRPPIVMTIDAVPVLNTVADVKADMRLGLHRVQAVFAHPIHFGLFCSIAFSMVFVAFKGQQSDFRRFFIAGLIAGAGFLALSSGALLAIMLQFGLIVWAAIFRELTWRWWLLLGLFAAGYVTIDLLSNRSPVHVFLSYATFSAHTAYWRMIIFEWGMVNVWANPFFGLGLNEWVRPSWMHSPSVDNFWLLTAMRYGVPAFLMVASGWVLILVRLMRLPLEGESRAGRIRRACVFTLIGLSFTLATVHVWSNIYSFTFFILGATVFLLQPGGEDDAQPAAPTPRPGLGSRTHRPAPALRAAASYTRFPGRAEAAATRYVRR